MNPSEPKPARSKLSHQSLRQSRRAFLRGAGVALTLPWLESLTGFTGSSSSALAAARPSNLPPMRLASLFMPNGVNTPDWSATQRGNTLELSKTLKPLQPHAEHLFIPRGLTHKGAHQGDGHYAKTANFLSGDVVVKTTGDDLTVGKSMDQLLAETIGDQTPLGSLVLATERTNRRVDTNVGFTQVYGGHISWSDANTPVAKEIFPRSVFDALFRVQPGAKGTKHVAQFGEDASVLDAVANDASRIRNQVSAFDRRQLESYYDSVRQLERRIAKMERQAAAEAWKPRYLNPDAFNRPAEGKPRDPSEHMRLMLDLQVLAFRMNVTRVSSFMFGNAVSGRNMSFLDGVDGGHHNISHHQNDPAKRTMYQKINEWHVEHLAYFLEQLGKVDEGGTSLLDNTMVLFGSGLSDGNAHSPRNLPIIAAGGGFKAKTGDYKGKPLCSLHITLMQRMGLNIQQFGDADKPL